MRPDRREKGLKKAKRSLYYFFEPWGNQTKDEAIEDGKERIKFWHKHRARCSCIGCGNRRKLEGKTKQELNGELGVKEQMKELANET